HNAACPRDLASSRRRIWLVVLGPTDPWGKAYPHRFRHLGAARSDAVCIRPQTAGTLRSSRAHGEWQVLPPAGATVPPWLPAKSARVSNCSLVNVLHRDDFSSGSNPATEKGEINPATAAASPDRLIEIRRYRGRAGSSFPFLPRRSALIPSRTLMYGSPGL